jgi:hypothetical protein
VQHWLLASESEDMKVIGNQTMCLQPKIKHFGAVSQQAGEHIIFIVF